MKITERGQVTIPKPLRERYGLGPDVEVEFVPGEQGLLLKKKGRRQDPFVKWRGALPGPADVDAYLEDIRGR